MTMTNEEILRSFSQAKVPAAQVKVLAELNACPVETIRRILMDQGVDSRRLPRERRETAKTSDTPAILRQLNQERERLEHRREEIDAMLPRLRKERESIGKKLAAIEKAWKVLAAVYEEAVHGDKGTAASV